MTTPRTDKKEAQILRDLRGKLIENSNDPYYKMRLHAENLESELYSVAPISNEALKATIDLISDALPDDPTEYSDFHENLQDAYDHLASIPLEPTP
tara:strand:+ start:280 stop:567 length:288 start_codon:yes stop_codon:yes gene_type:complete